MVLSTPRDINPSLPFLLLVFSWLRFFWRKQLIGYYNSTTVPQRSKTTIKTNRKSHTLPVKRNHRHAILKRQEVLKVAYRTYRLLHYGDAAITQCTSDDLFHLMTGMSPVQVTLCNPIWHVNSSSGESMSANCYNPFTYLHTTLPMTLSDPWRLFELTEIHPAPVARYV